MSPTHTACTVLGTLILASCGGSTPAPPPNAVVSISMDPSTWVFPYSPNMGTASPAPGGWQFTFPTQDGIHMAVTGVQGRLQGSKLITAFTIQKTGEILEVQPCGTNSARVRLFLQQRGDDWSGSGKYEFYRWYSEPADLNNPPPGLTAPLQPNSWSSVLGKSGDANPSGFATAISDLQAIGFAFGGCFAAHGVYGSAIFTATTYRVE